MERFKVKMTVSYLVVSFLVIFLHLSISVNKSIILSLQQCFLVFYTVLLYPKLLSALLFYVGAFITEDHSQLGVPTKLVFGEKQKNY